MTNRSGKFQTHLWRIVSFRKDVPTWLKIVDWAVNNSGNTTVASLNAILGWESSHSIIIINAPVYQRI